MNSDHSSDGDDLLTMLQRMKEEAENLEVPEPQEQAEVASESNNPTDKASNNWGAPSTKGSDAIPGDARKGTEEVPQIPGQSVDLSVQSGLSEKGPEPSEAPARSKGEPALLYNDALKYDEGAAEGAGEVLPTEGSASDQESAAAETVEISKEHVERLADLRKQRGVDTSAAKATLQSWSDGEVLGETADTPAQRFEEIDSWEDGRPQRYTHPTRTIPLGPEYENPRVVSSSNLVGAPPPRPGATSYRVKISPVFFKELVFLLGLLLGVPCGILFLMFSVQHQDVDFDLVDVQVKSTRLRESGEKSLILDQGSLDLTEAELEMPELHKDSGEDQEGVTGPSVKPQFAILILETSDIDEYKDVLGRLQKDGFEVSVEVLDEGTLFRIMALEAEKSAIDEVLLRLKSLDYLTEVDLKVVQLGPNSASEEEGSQSIGDLDL